MQSANFYKMTYGIIYFTLNPLSILQDYSRVQKTVTTLFCTYNKILSTLAFISVKSLNVISSFNLKRMKKIVRWHCGTKISKTNLKAIISPLLSCPQGCQLKTTLVSWSNKIQPKLNKIQKAFRKKGFFETFCPILTVFHSLFNLAES